MKASELKKDGNFSGRINKEVLAMLKKRGITVQKIVDDYIDKLELDLKIKKQNKPLQNIKLETRAK